MKSQRNSFTLIELLVVIGVIALLGAITLGAAGAMQNTAARTRTRAEIAAISTALESYKTDNGAYPEPASGAAEPNASYSATTYRISATNLYFSLSGSLANWTGTPTTPVYMTFKKNMLDSTVSCGVRDPFGNYYGYNSGSNAIMNVGFYDLWSTAGKTRFTAADTNAWLTNWTPN